jgi:DNA polymerase sigma
MRGISITLSVIQYYTIFRGFWQGEIKKYGRFCYSLIGYLKRLEFLLSKELKIEDKKREKTIRVGLKGLSDFLESYLKSSPYSLIAVF